MEYEVVKPEKLVAKFDCDASGPRSASPEPLPNSAAGATAILPWAEPQPLDGADEFGPTAPLDCFPGALRDHIAESAYILQAPIDLCALSALTTFAAAAQRVALVRIGPKLVTQLSLYCVGVARPSERKSAIHTAMTAPLYGWERQYNARNADAVRERAHDRSSLQGRIKAFEQARNRAKTSSDLTHWDRQILALKKELDGSPELVPLQLTVDDITAEQLVVVLQRQRNCIALLSDEAGTFQNTLLGRYDSTGRADLDIWLKGYDGGRVAVERKKENSLLIVERPRVTLGLFAQTGMLRDMATERSLNQRGLIARVCFVRAESRVGRRKFVTSDPIVDFERRYTDVLGAILDMPVSDSALELDFQALLLWTEYHDRIETELRGGLAEIEELAGKHPARAARIAAIWHLVRHGSRAFERKIDATSMGTAIEVADWLLGHQLAIAEWLYGQSEARRVLGWAKRKRVQETTVRKIVQALHNPRESSRVTSIEIRAGLDELVSKGWARLSVSGRSSLIVQFHPKLLGEK
jgi:hypothetical protein